MPDDSFKAFVLDQLSALPELRARAMFGGHGLYSGDHFFAILYEGRLYFKVSEATRADYEARGAGPFIYEMKGRVMTMNYYEVPPGVLEDRNELHAWANQAVRVAQYHPRAGKRRPFARKQRPSEFSGRRQD